MNGLVGNGTATKGACEAMNGKRDFIRRYIAVPVAVTLLVMMAVAGVNAMNAENMVATDGLIEVVDGGHIQTLSRRLPFASGDSLRITNRNGKIVVSSWDREEMALIAEKRLKRRVGGLGWVLDKLNMPYETPEDLEDYFDAVDIEVNSVAGGIEVETIIPKWDPMVNVSVNYEVRIPRQANLVLTTSNGLVCVTGVEGVVSARSSNGKVVCEDVAGSVKARTSNGTIVCRGISGPMEVRTSNGSIRVERVGVLEGEDSISCVTSNGSIELNLPEDCSFEIHATTSNGRVRTSFPIEQTDGRHNGKRLAGRVGNGGPRIELRSSNGSIRVNPT